MHALDRFGYIYHTYVPHLLNAVDMCYETYEPGCVSCTPHAASTLNDTLIVNNCAPSLQTNATQFINNGTDGVYVLYKHNANNELYLTESYSTIKI